ncbi:hypothetical protein [Polaromonas sp.]|uniref:hypothetical protein n=1 Tax=Polaromonas sp. TaxID=1869339 RepID=UPI0013BC816F|nr:hypothetical protein [Polaromonas sp.]NDP61881.1 hypothetical protein [Polaromonas sp.]
MFPKTKILHFFAGMACAALASPFGIIAAALTPVGLGFAKEMYLHFTGQGGDAENFAWTIAGAATFVLWLRLMPIRL